MTDEIALNPAHFAGRTPAEMLSTLVHEMAHLWQHHFGKPSRSGYHNKEWAAKMREIGLIPTDTGQPGGKDTGQKVTHNIEEGGRFDQACTAFLATGTRHPLPRPGRRGRSRHPQEESRQQDQIHLPGMRAERLGQARRPPDLRRLRGGDGSRGAGAGGGLTAATPLQLSSSVTLMRVMTTALSSLAGLPPGHSRIQATRCRYR